MECRGGRGERERRRGEEGAGGEGKGESRGEVKGCKEGGNLAKERGVFFVADGGEREFGGE